MSFDFDPSDGEGSFASDDLQSWSKRHGFSDGVHAEYTSDVETVSGATTHRQWTDGGVDNESDHVFWEDAHDSEDERKPSPVSEPRVDGSSQEEENGRKQKRATQRRKSIRVRSLPITFQKWIRSLHRTEVLIWLSHLTWLSSVAADYEVVAVAHSLIPLQFVLYQSAVPTYDRVCEFAQWFREWVNSVASRRLAQERRNRAEGAPPMPGSNRTRAKKKRKVEDEKNSRTTQGFVIQDLFGYMNYLSVVHDRDPQLFDLEPPDDALLRTLRVLLFVAMIRSLGWRCRYVQALPIAPAGDFDENHPVWKSMQMFTDFASCLRKKVNGAKSTATQHLSSTLLDNGKRQRLDEPQPASNWPLLAWAEVLCQQEGAEKGHEVRWIHFDPVRQLFDRPDLAEILWKDCIQGRDGMPSRRSMKPSQKGHANGANMKRNRETLAYAAAVDHHPAEPQVAIISDVTQRYSYSWVESLRRRGISHQDARLSRRHSGDDRLRDAWLLDTLANINGKPRRRRGGVTPLRSGIEVVNVDTGIVETTKSRPETLQDPLELMGDEELQDANGNEAIPTSKASFKNHPLYAISSSLNQREVLAPDANARIRGVFKGEMVYLRKDVSVARTSRQWLYEGRRVLDRELTSPIRRLKARKKVKEQTSSR
jgi:Rad4 beta-hairpin domain 1